MAKAKPFRNRIVGRGEVLASELKANPANWRLHPDVQRAALSAVLTDVGWIDDVTVNKRTGRMLDGHLRVEIAAARGEKVPVKYVDLTPAEEKLALASLDPIGAMALTDDAQLQELLSTIEVGDNPELNALLDQLLSEAMIETPHELPPETGEPGPAKDSPSQSRNLGARRAQIKPVLYASQVAVFERAIRLTGEPNRGKAVIQICQQFVDQQEAKRK